MKIEIPNRTLILIAILLVVAFFAGYTLRSHPLSTLGPNSTVTTYPSKINADVRITDAKMALGLDDQLMPIDPTEVFPRNTQRVYCWFSWEDAVPQTEMKANWNYAIDDIHILTYNFKIPRKKGSGGISLIMPSGKVLPVGSYRIDLMAKNQVLKSLEFKVK